MAPELRYFAGRVRRHWRWARAQGVRRLIEEDELDPIAGIENTYRKWRWRRAHSVTRGTAMPVYLVGLQRSGTNMVARALGASPEVEVHNENDRRAFHHFRLRADDVIAGIIDSSLHSYVLFKPLIDSHRVDHLLDELPVQTPGRAIWVFRQVDDRVRSALAKFEDANHRALSAIAMGKGDDLWESQRMSRENIELVGSFNYRYLSSESASALFWYVRNSLYFEMDLHRRSDVMAVSYDRLVADPEASMRSICRFLSLDWDARLISRIEARAGQEREPLPLDARIRRLCNDLQARLDEAAAKGSGNDP
jgi:Sulfotransferase family